MTPNVTFGGTVEKYKLANKTEHAHNERDKERGTYGEIV